MPQFPILLPGSSAAADPPIDHAATLIARLAQQYKERPNLAALLTAISAQAQTLETAFQDLINERTIAGAFGAQLDLIGRVVKQARQGQDDDTYRATLRARVLLNRTSGTAEEIYTLMSLLKPAGATLRLRDEWPAGFTMEVNSVPLTAASLLASFLRLGRGAGIRGIMEWSESSVADTFTFDGLASQALDVGKFKGGAI